MIRWCMWRVEAVHASAKFKTMWRYIGHVLFGARHHGRRMLHPDGRSMLRRAMHDIELLINDGLHGGWPCVLRGGCGGCGLMPWWTEGVSVGSRGGSHVVR